MEQISSLDDYLQRINGLHRSKAAFTNNYMMAGDAERLISLGRLYCFTNEAGIVFLSDEDTHYRASLYMDTNQSCELPLLDKPLMIQIVYHKDKKKDNHLRIEEQLEANEFVKQDTSVQAKLNVEEHKAEYQKNFDRLYKLVRRMGYRIKAVDFTYRDKIREVFLQQDMMHDWHYPFQTEEEVQAQFEQDGWICVLDQDDRVLAYHSAYEVNSCCYGMGMAIRDEYKVKYGFAPLLQYYRVCITEQPLIYGEVLLHNTEALALHEKLGWKFTNKYVDRWLKNK